VLPDSSNRVSSSMIRSSSFESLHRTPNERQSPNEDERKRQATLRNRACNDSFRQAVDKSYCQNNNDGMIKKVLSLGHEILIDLDFINGDKSNKTEKQRFRFSNLFTTK
jgi:hypothetical protein